MKNSVLAGFGCGKELQMTSLHGSLAYPFGQMFADTVKAHGVLWACGYYLGRGMEQWELRFWLSTLDYYGGRENA